MAGSHTLIEMIELNSTLKLDITRKPRYDLDN